jgi:hypothetical protein
MVPENRQNRIYKQINCIGLQNNRHASQHTFGNVHEASGNCQQRPLYESIAEPLSHVLGLPPRGPHTVDLEVKQVPLPHYTLSILMVGYKWTRNT